MPTVFLMLASSICVFFSPPFLGVDCVCTGCGSLSVCYVPSRLVKTAFAVLVNAKEGVL